MITTSQSYLYQVLDKSSGITKQISAITDNKVPMKRITNELDLVISKIRNQYKNVLISKAIEAFYDGKIVLCYSEDPKFNLAICIPFFKYMAKDGKPKTVINITNYLRKMPVPNNKDQYEYEMKTTQLYVLLMSAYAQSEIFLPNATLPNTVNNYMADLWGEMFLGPINKYLSLKGNTDKYSFYKYTLGKFFAMYYLQLPVASANNVGIDVSKSGVNSPYIGEFEAMFGDEEIYKDYEEFLKAIFSPKFTAIKTGKFATRSGTGTTLTPSLYLKMFISTYDFINVGSLISVPYFFFTITGTFHKAFFGGDRAFEPIVIKTNSKMVPEIINKLGAI